ncbi:unnamed protein product [Paramecium sonneborni]|uniref:TOG domain-containing protein n=1 Tax=Paramecium sonneborni TaxID=65129 RepID=A0A8S1R1A6_9CILI|nr:unnamed protein product [Paramecium sonneborni]
MEQVDYYELLKRFQYSYIKPNAQLRHYLQSLTPDQYPDLFQNIENLNYDSHKIKRLLRFLKKPHLVPQYFHLKLKHKLKINESVPQGVVDFNKKNSLILTSQQQGQLLFDKLKEEFFVDSKLRKTDSLTFKHQYYQALQDNLTNQCIEQCLRLLKRSEQNMDTLIIVLTELAQTQYDITPQLVAIHNALTEFIKNDLSITCLKLAHSCIKGDLSTAVTFIGKMIQGTHDENRKFAFLSTLPHRCEKQIELIYNLATVLNDDQKVFDLIKRMRDLKVPLGNWAHLKKLLTINKYTNTFVSLLVVDWLLEKQQESNSKDLESVMELIVNGLATNFKNFAKVVTQPVMFLAQLKCVVLYALFCEEDAPAKLMITINENLNKNTDIFNSKSHLCQLKYLISPSCQNESQLFLDCLLVYQAITYDENDQFNYLLPLITLIAFSGKVKNSVNVKQSLELLKLFQAIDINILYNKIFKTLHEFLYQINPYQGEGINFRKDRLVHFVRLIKNQIANTQIENPQYIYTTFSHTFISQFKNNLPKYDIEVNPISWFTNRGLMSNNPYTVQSTINYCRLLVDQGFIDDIVKPIEEWVNPNNINKLSSLDHLDEQLEQIQIQQLNHTNLQQSGLKVMTNDKPLDESELQLQQELKKFENNNAVLMDEGEAKQQMLLKQKNKMCQQYSLCLKLFEGILYTKSKEQFITKYFNQISAFAKEISTRYDCCMFLLKYFETNPLLQQFKWPLTFFFLERSMNSIPNDKILEKINQFQDCLLKEIQNPPIHLIHLMNLYIINQNAFTPITKFKTFSIILKYKDQLTINEYFTPFVVNINICGHAKNAGHVLQLIFNKDSQQHYDLFFNNILNLVPEAQNLILKTIPSLPDNFDIHIKVRVLAEFDETKEAALPFVDKEFKVLNQLQKWDIVSFVKKFPREHSEVMINILNEVNGFPEMIIQAASKLVVDQQLQEEQLEFFPYFVSKQLNIYPKHLIGKTIDLLIQYSSTPERQQLAVLCREAGVQLIKLLGKENSNDILIQIEAHLQSKNVCASIRAITYLGVLSQFLQGHNQRKTQEQIVQLFRNSDKDSQLELARSLQELLSFFPDTENLVIELLKSNKLEKDENVKRGNAYMIAGLIKGLGVEMMEKLGIFELLEVKERKESLEDKFYVLIQLQAMIDLFQKILEPYVLKVMGILMKYFGEGKVEVRNLAMTNASRLLQSLSSYGVKIMLQPLLEGLDSDTQWRAKVANIWALGHLAHCSPKQLSSCLPQIVNSISKAISDTHPDVKAEANKSLNEIGSTIKNPEISSIADILIISLSNPYDENLRGLQVVLETKFRHYIDAPAMSLLIPIIDYGLRAQDSNQRSQASILIGGLPHLIQKSDDLVPYMNLIVGGLEVVIGDPLLEVRTVAAKAIGQLSKKIGIENTKQFFKFIWDVLENKEASTNKRSGAAHAFAEISCIHGDTFLEESLQFIFTQIQRPEIFVKEGYIGIFIYIPSILQQKFENYVKDVIENVYECVSHEDDVVSSITLRVLKILIKNFGILQNELLYPSLTETMLNEDAKKRNAGTILSGEMLKITQKYVFAQLNNPDSQQYINIDLYYLNLMTLYTMQQDVADVVRQNAVAIWKEFIDNTPKTLKKGLKQYVIQLCNIMSRDGVVQNGINSIRNFCEKYGETQMSEAFNHIGFVLQNYQDNLSLVKGAYSVLNQIYIHISLDIATRYRDQFIEYSRIYIFCKDNMIKQQLFQSIGTMINKVKQTTFVELIIEPYLIELAAMDENDPKYSGYLEVFQRLCSLNQTLVLHYLIVLILVPPLHQFKIDILTNNASTFSSVIYKKYENKIPIQILFNDLYLCAEFNDHNEWNDRTESLIYCIQQLSIHIKSDIENYLALFIEDILRQLSIKSKPIFESEAHPNDYKHCLIPLEVLQYFLKNTSEDHQQFSQAIIEKVTPFLYLQSNSLSKQQLEQFYNLANKILYAINNTLDKQHHFDNMRNIHTCFMNRINNNVIPGLSLQDGAGIEPYVSMLIDSFVFGKEETFKYAYDFMKILIRSADYQQLQIYILKLVGALIRILNYKGNNELKVLALQLIHQSQEKGLELQKFKPQLAITYEKLIIDINLVDGGLKQLSKNYSQFLKMHDKKDLLLNQLFNKGVQSVTQEARECHLKIVKKAIKDQQEQVYSSAVLERFFTLSKQYFEKCIQSSKFDLASPCELNRLAHILAQTYNYTNKNNKEQYVQKYMKFDQYGLLLKLQFVRYQMKDLLPDIIAYAIEQVNTNENMTYVLQILRNLRKFPNIQVKQQLKPKFMEIPQILSALSRLQ